MSRVIKLAILAALVALVAANAHDIKRYIAISRM